MSETPPSSERKRRIRIALRLSAVLLAILLTPYLLAESIFLIGRLHDRRYDYPRAVQAYSTAIWIRSRPTMYGARAEALDSLGRYAEAIKDWDEALRLGAPRLSVLHGRGRAKLFLADLTGAIEDWSAAIEIAPRDPDLYYSRGIARFRKRDVRGAIEDYTTSLSLDTQPFHMIYKARALARLETGDIDGAIEDATACLNRNGKVGEAFVVWARALEAKGDADTALLKYGNAIDLVGPDPGPYLYRSDLYLRKGDPRSALKDAEDVVRRDPKLPEGYLARGRAKSALGDSAGARSDFHLALSMASPSWEHRGLVTTLLKALSP